jgi:hypothetical protein
MATQTMNPSFSMSTSSLTAASTIANSVANSSEKTKSDQSVQKMQSNLIRYTRAQDRRMVLRSLKDVAFLSALTLEPIEQSETEFSDLENEICEETVILNGIPFKPIGRTAAGKIRGSNCTLSMLKGVCDKICDMAKSDLKSDDLYQQLVLRMAKTTASADSYFRLNSLLGSSDLLVMPLTSDNLQAEKTPRSVTLQKLSAQKEAPVANQPIRLNIYETHGSSVHMTISQTYKFGLFRKSDVKSGRAWIGIDAVVSERANMTTEKSVRILNVKLPDLY